MQLFNVTSLQFEVLIFFPVSLFPSNPQPSVLIVSYIESAKAAAQFGFYQKAEWKPDDSMIAVAVSTLQSSSSCNLISFQLKSVLAFRPSLTYYQN